MTMKNQKGALKERKLEVYSKNKGKRMKCETVSYTLAESSKVQFSTSSTSNLTNGM